ncbi:MAG: dTMP kinase [Halobacteriovoraceae bacterium]|nr:dTMP kinase [Halobacteriovoraceae bacterium]|tara:strand:+ start:11579 stop:12241 length:663 start_codon:yes stop_codon:yes gene_type:complete
MNSFDHFTSAPTHSSSLFLSFEGIEGSGKSTQIELVEQYFKDKNYQVLKLREPGGTSFGEKLREAILHSETPLSSLAEAHLFAASRAQLLKEKILPALAQENTIVIVDRYIDSSMAYQGVARGLGSEVIAEIHRHSPLNYMPQMTFYLYIDLETSHQRQQARGNTKDYFEKENHSFYQHLIEGYDHCASVFPTRIKKIDATQSVEQVNQAILKELPHPWN